MPRIRTRAGKGALLTNAEIDDMHKRGATAISDDYTAQVSDNRDTLLVSGETTISLPVASVILGLAETGDWRVTVKNVGEDAVAVEAVGGDAIDGESEITLAPGDCVVVQAVAGGYVMLAYVPVTYPDAALLGGEDGAHYLDRANHTGTQAPVTVSPQGAGSGLDADTVDGQHANAFAPTNQGVTNGNSHDHIGGDGAPIGTNALANLAVTEAKIANNAVSTSKIPNNAITTAKIGAEQVTDAKLVQFAAGTARLAAAYPEIESFAPPVSSDNAVVKATFLVLRGGTVTARARVRPGSPEDDWRIRWRRNGSEVGSTVTVEGGYANYDQNISVSAGDYLELVFWRAGNQTAVGSFDVAAVELRTTAAALQGGACALPIPNPNTGL